jgi:hypothetical protein
MAAPGWCPSTRATGVALAELAHAPANVKREYYLGLHQADRVPTIWMTIKRSLRENGREPARQDAPRILG